MISSGEYFLRAISAPYSKVQYSLKTGPVLSGQVKRRMLLWGGVFLIFYVRFLLAELFKGEKYHAVEVATIDDWKRSVIEHKVKGREDKENTIYFDYLWKFSQKLPVRPVVYIDEIKINDTNGWYKDYELSEYEGSDSHTNFRLKLKFQGTLPEVNFTDLVESITLVATAEQYSLDSFRGKVLNLFSVKLRKMIPKLC